MFSQEHPQRTTEGEQREQSKVHQHGSEREK